MRTSHEIDRLEIVAASSAAQVSLKILLECSHSSLFARPWWQILRLKILAFAFAFGTLSQ